MSTDVMAEVEPIVQGGRYVAALYRHHDVFGVEGTDPTTRYNMWQDWADYVHGCLPTPDMFKRVFEGRNLGDRRVFVLAESVNLIAFIVREEPLIVLMVKPGGEFNHMALTDLATRWFDKIAVHYVATVKIHSKENVKMHVPAYKIQPGTGFRLARGDKFETVMDSFLYAVAREDAMDAVRCRDGSWVACFPEGPVCFGLLVALAKKSGKTMEALGLNKAELQTVADMLGAVMIEDHEGYVKVEYFRHGKEDAVYETFMEWAQNHGGDILDGMVRDDYSVPDDITEWGPEEFQAAGAMMREGVEVPPPMPSDATYPEDGVM